MLFLYNELIKIVPKNAVMLNILSITQKLKKHFLHYFCRILQFDAIKSIIDVFLIANLKSVDTKLE